MKFGDKDITLKLGDKDVTIKLGEISVFTPDREPSSGVPIDSSFAVMIGGTWHQYNLNPEDYTVDQGQLWTDDIVAILQNDNLDYYDVEELSIGCESFVNLDGWGFPNCTGLTLSPCVTRTSDIHNFDSIGWVYVMGQELFVEVNEEGFRLFENMNCCPIYVPEASLSDYQSAWENETTDDCGGTVADRLRVWGDYPEPCNSPKVSLYSGNGEEEPWELITEVYYPTGIIPTEAFRGDVYGGNRVDISSGITEIGDRAFMECSMSKVNIGADVTSIGEECFMDCGGLDEIKSYRSAAPTLGSYAFDNAGWGEGTLHVPQTNSGYSTWMSQLNGWTLDNDLP